MNKLSIYNILNKKLKIINIKYSRNQYLKE